MKKSYFLLILILLFNSCSPDEESISEEPKEIDATPELSDYEEDVIFYFMKIALGLEFGDDRLIIRKWASNMKIYVGGKQVDYLNEELESIVEEINNLTTDGFQIEIVQNLEKANYYIFLGTGEEYADKFPSTANFVDDNWGLFSIRTNDNYEILEGRMYVDIERANYNEQLHLLREELTQSLGLARDSHIYKNSIFQQDWTSTVNYMEIDKDLISLLYNPKMSAGVEGPEAKKIITDILSSN